MSQRDPILKPGEMVDYFDIWHALSTRQPLPDYVYRWTERSVSREHYLVKLLQGVANAAIFSNATPMDFVEMINRMIVDINDIAYRERTERFATADMLSGGSE
jgi:hypothetical protein